MSNLYIGLMSGTSLDGADGVLVEFAADRGGLPGLRIMAHAHQSFPPDLAGTLLSLNSPGSNELHRAALAANALAECYANVVESLLGTSAVHASQVRAIGAHGQTVRHRPGEFDGVGYTLQLNAPALLAERTGVSVVADFRSRDVAAGGQGAPLVPAFHRAMFAREAVPLAVLNIGGFSNLTAESRDGTTLGFDCGPGNALLDLWCAKQTGNAFDDGGRWAATGRVLDPLLADLLDEPYFERLPPKSTGRDLFNADWLVTRLQQQTAATVPRAEDVQCTLVELTARTVARQVQRHAGDAAELLVCGGGARNGFLMDRIRALLSNVHVLATDARGLPCMQVEACAFAWLAHAHLEGVCASLPGVTGARAPRVLGAFYPA